MTKRLLLLLFCGLPFLAHAETFKARLEWAHTVDLRFVEDGVVETVPVLIGQEVLAGEVLAELDSREFELNRVEAAARVSRSEASLARAQRQLEWAKELYDRGLISDNERLEAEENAASAWAENELARAGLGKAELALERATLKAPFNGMVVELDTWPGQVVVKQLQRDPLVVLADSDRMVARARLTAERLRGFRPGDQARVRLGNGPWRPGVVYRRGVLSEDVIERGAVYALDVLFETSPEESLRPGQPASIQLGEAP